MKIGIFCTQLLKTYKAGIHWYAYNLVHHLANIDRENVYIFYDFVFKEFRAKKRLMATFLPQQDNFKKNLYKFPLSLTKYIPIEFFTGRIDMIHAVAPKIKIYFTLKARRIVTIHDIIPWLEIKTNVNWRVLNPEEQRRKAELIEKSILKSHKIIAVSENTKRDIIKHFSITPLKIAVIYEGTDEIFKPVQHTKKIEEVKKKYNINKRFILTTGNYTPRKNLGRLLSGFERIRRKNTCQLVIFGNIKQQSEWFEVFERLPANIKKDVIFTGYVFLDDLPYLYSGAEFFIYPSLYEGFGLPPLEAMSCGCPVITSNTSSLPEVVGDAGILIDPYNVDEIAENMERLLLDEKLREELKIKGLERAKQFTWEKTARETLKVYEEVYNER